MRTELIHASELLQRNTPEAVEEAIGLLQNTVFSFSMKMCGHRQDAEDTMQEVLFRSIKHLSKLVDPNALAAWLYTVTRNRCHRMRRGHFDRNERRLSLEELMPDEEELRALLLESQRGPEDSAIHGEERHLLHQAVLRIPTPLRMVLVLHDMEELTSEQIGTIGPANWNSSCSSSPGEAGRQEGDDAAPEGNSGAEERGETRDIKEAGRVPRAIRESVGVFGRTS
jgi:RNA polymerase sigma-70 factor (ECF subfamily)